MSIVPSPAVPSPTARPGATTRRAAGGASSSVLPPLVRVETRVGRLAVRDTGAEPPGGEVIVLWPSILADHRIYRAQIEAWQGRHRLVIVDGPGHGDSGAAPGSFSMADCGEALAEVLDALQIHRPVVVVGTSWGGLVGGEFALSHPERVRALVMLNTPVLTATGGAGFGEHFVTWGARWIHGTPIYRQGVARSFFLPATRERGGPVLEGFHRHLREADGAALARSVRAVMIERAPLAPRLAGIAAPALVVAGRHDELYPVESLRAASAVLRQGRFEVVDSAHIAVVDAPQETTSLIDRFLATLAAAPASVANGEAGRPA